MHINVLTLFLQVVNTSLEPDLSRSLAQLRARLGGCWLSSAQAATVASVIPRVLSGDKSNISTPTDYWLGGSGKSMELGKTTENVALVTRAVRVSSTLLRQAGNAGVAYISGVTSHCFKSCLLHGPL